VRSLSRSRIAAWVLACALPAEDVEIILGDLEEEYALRSRSTRGSLPWYWAQIVRSMPVFLWLPVRRGGWVPTLGVALGACAIQAMIELTTKFAIVGLFHPDARWPAFITLMVTLPSLTLLSYLAARIRPGAATMLTAIIVFAVVLQLVVKDDHGMTFWAQLATLFVGPSVAFTGGVLSLRTRAETKLQSGRDSVVPSGQGVV
jgi:hypothetical protein